MLLNSKGHIVHLHQRFNTKEHPSMFLPLREVKEPSQPAHGSMFRLETRATFKK